MAATDLPSGGYKNGKKEDTERGPVELTHDFLRTCIDYGAISVVYSYAHRYTPEKAALSLFHSASAPEFSYDAIPESHRQGLKRCHELVLNGAKPLVFSQFLPTLRELEPALTRQIMSEAKKYGVVDQYMIPVFGPFDINGVLSLGFAEEISEEFAATARILEGAAAGHHNRLVRHFHSGRADIELSQRENQVLNWIARGKSRTDIATILGIGVSSVDTYTRRIFEKMGVHDRVTAAVNAVVEGLIQPND